MRRKENVILRISVMKKFGRRLRSRCFCGNNTVYLVRMFEDSHSELFGRDPKITEDWRPFSKTYDVFSFLSYVSGVATTCVVLVSFYSSLLPSFLPLFPLSLPPYLFIFLESQLCFYLIFRKIFQHSGHL